LSFRRSIGPARAAELPLRLPLHPMPTVFAIVALLTIAATTLFVDGLRYSLPLFVPFLLLISMAYWKLQKNRDPV
jgi:L-asparagine transporter-like permease